MKRYQDLMPYGTLQLQGKRIIVVYLVYSSFKKEYEDILFHAGIAIPPYHPTNSDKKFDANWQILQFSSPKKL